jgi:hypothetical protein
MVAFKRKGGRSRPVHRSAPVLGAFRFLHAIPWRTMTKSVENSVTLLALPCSPFGREDGA